MKARRRLATAALLLLIFLGGTIAVVVLTPADGERDAGLDATALVETETDARSERHRVRVGDAPETADAPESPRATVTTTAIVTSRVRRPAESDAPPTTGPIRFRREEPSGDGEQGALRIRVDDGAGAARDDVRVNVLAATNGTRGTRYAGTIPSTGITIDDVDAGWATVTLTAGSLTRTTRVRVETGLLTDVELSLPRGATIYGEVRHREHGLLADITVDFGTLGPSRIVEGDFRDAIHGTTDADGIYRLTGIQPGRCILTFKGGPLGHGLQPRASFDVPAVDELRHDVLLGTVSLEGVVRGGADRVPIANAKVSVQGPYFATTSTDAQGRYEFVDLVLGPQKVCVSADGFGVMFTESEPVLADRVTRCDVDLAAAVSLRLHLTDDEGAPVTTEVDVSFRPKPGTTGTRLSTNLRPDADGRIVYDKVVTGSYAIAVSDRMGGYERAETETELRPGPNELDVVLTRSSAEGVTIYAEGTVTSADTGAPVAGAEIQCQGRAMTNAKGQFEIRGYGTRPPFLSVRCDGYANERMQVPAEGPIEITLRRAAEVILHVRAKDGGPFVGRLGLHFAPRDEDGTRLLVRVEADEHGTAAVRRVVPGRYGLNIVPASRFGRAELEIDIQPGRNEFDLDLR